MRILHVITSLSMGGAERMLQKLVRALDSAIYASSVVSLTDIAPIGIELQAEGTRVVGLNGSGGVLTPWQIWRLRRYYESVQPDVVHAWMYHSNLAAQLLVGGSPRKTRPGLILSVRGALHATREQKRLSRLVRRLDASMSHRADAIVFNSQRSAEQHIAIGYAGDKSHVIPNCFDTTAFDSSPTERSRIRAEIGCGECILVGLVARFDRLKGQRTFLEAARLIAARDRLYRFLLVGRGCDRNNTELVSWVDEFGLAGKVFLLGERRDIAAIDNALEIGVCASISESFPNAIGEAMACRVPCVVTDVGDCGYLVGDSGYVVPPRDAQALAAAILQLGGLPEGDRLRLGEHARRRVMSEFSTAAVVQRFSDLYDCCGRR